MRKEPSGIKFDKVAVVSKVPPETMRAVEVNGRRVLIINLEGEIHALDGRCPIAVARWIRGICGGELSNAHGTITAMMSKWGKISTRATSIQLT